MDNQGLFDEIGPSHQPVAGQLALAEAIRREQAKAAAEAAAVKQLTPMGSKGPAQRQ